MTTEAPPCPECGTLAGQSMGSVSTLMSYNEFRDENGKWHVHDPNRITGSMLCVNGHTYSYTIPRTCWCGWTSEVTT